MDFLHIPKQDETTPLLSGQLLVAEPFMPDGNFSRSVVLLCEHAEDGTVGFVINKPTGLNLADLMAEIPAAFIPINQGGPVMPDTLHMLHRLPDELGGIQVAPGIYWGGSFEILQDLILNETFNENDIRLFTGYSGWSVGQLEKEMKEGSWYIGNATPELIFDTETHDIWANAIRSLGPEFTHLVNMPSNPQFN